MVQIRLHILQELQDPMTQDVEETFQDVKLLVHQLQHKECDVIIIYIMIYVIKRCLQLHVKGKSLVIVLGLTGVTWL